MNFLSQSGRDAMIAAETPQMTPRRDEPMSIQPGRRMPPAEQERLDAMARQNGFKNYEEMRVFLLRRQEGATVQGSTDGRAPMGVKTAMSWHPANLLNYSVEKIRGALGL